MWSILGMVGGPSSALHPTITEPITISSAPLKTKGIDLSRETWGWGFQSRAYSKGAFFRSSKCAAVTKSLVGSWTTLQPVLKAERCPAAPAAEAWKRLTETSFSSCQDCDTSHRGEEKSLSREANVSNTSYHNSDSQLHHWPFRMETEEPVFLFLMPQNNIRCVLNHTHQPWTLQAFMSIERYRVVMPRGRWFSWFIEVLPALSQTLSPEMLPLSGEIHRENPASQCSCPSRARHFWRNSWLRKIVKIFKYQKIDRIISRLSSIHFKTKF